MSTYNSEIALVAQITVKNKYESLVYYVTNRDGITLDSINYANAVLSFGDAPSLSPIDGESRTGSMSIKLVNGELFAGNGYIFNNTYGWNNQHVIVKRWTKNTTTFNDCQPYWSGIIKSHSFDESGIEFTVDYIDNRDTIKFPSVVIEDQSTIEDIDIISPITAGDYYIYASGIENIYTNLSLALLESKTHRETVYIKKVYVDYVEVFEPIVNSYSINDTKVKKPFKNVPAEFIGKTVPVQFGVLNNTTDGTFAKTITSSGKVGDQKILLDTMKSSSVINLGVYEEGLKRFFGAKKEYTQQAEISNTCNSGQKIVYSKNAGIFISGQSIVIQDDLNSEFGIVDYTERNFGTVFDGKIHLVNNLQHTYTVANNAIVYSNSGEYQINTDNKTIDFQIDSIAELDDSFSMNDQDGVEYLQLKSGHAKLIRWVNDDSRLVSENQELMSTNIIRIDNELMLLVEQPNTTNDTICVERGYSDSDIEPHIAGSKIYQSPEFSAKNMLIFSARIDPVAPANMYYSSYVSAGNFNYYSKPDQFINKKLSNMFSQSGTPFEYVQRTYFKDGVSCSTYYGFDLKFPDIASNYKIYSAFVGLSASILAQMSVNDDGYFRFSRICLHNLSVTGYNDKVILDDDSEFTVLFAISKDDFKTTNTYDDMYAADDFGAFELTSDSIYSISSLSDLNNKIRLFIESVSTSENNRPEGIITLEYFNINNIGIWVNFLVDFTQEKISALLAGRKNSQAVATVLNNNAYNDALATTVFQTIISILTTEGGYSASDFTDNWEVLNNYLISITTGDVLPEVAISYGVDDDRDEVFSFCQKIARTANCQLIKTQDGKIDIVDLYRFYTDTSIVATGIELDDILFIKNTGSRRIKVEQTGTDQIFNDIVVKYQINNKTGEFQKSYTLPDTTILTHRNTIDPLTVRQSKEIYYNGDKKTLEIEAPYLINDLEVSRLALVEALEKSQCHYFATFTLDYDHYANINLLDNQYSVGRCVYLNGAYAGIRFSGSNLWRITNVTGKDQGREIEIQCKSMQACHEFTFVQDSVENIEKTLSALTAPDQIEKSITSTDNIQKVI